MAQVIDMKVTWDPKDLLVPMKILKKMSSFSQDTWEGVEDTVSSFTSDTSKRIKGKRVKPGTYSWRKGYAKYKGGKKVETYRGQMQVPNVSWAVGDRTGTFLDAYSNLEEPGVTIWQGTPWGGAKRGYGTPIKNGSFSIQINPDQFAQIKGWGGYPNFFQNYLIKKGILPKDGFFGLSAPVQKTIMYALETKVERHWSRIGKEV